MEWKYVKKLKNPNDVVEFLRKYNIVLPKQLVTCMERFNGGRPSEKEIITITSREYVFKTMLSYNSNDKDTIYSVYPGVFGETDWYPLASDAAGNFVCYDTSNKKYVLYNHEIDRVEEIIKMALFSTIDELIED